MRACHAPISFALVSKAQDATAPFLSANPSRTCVAAVFFGLLIDHYDRRRNGEILAVSLTALLIIMGLLCAWLREPLDIAGTKVEVVAMPLEKLALAANIQDGR